MRSWIACALVACQQSAPPPPAPAPSPSPTPAPTTVVAPTPIWELDGGAEPFAVVGDAVLAYDAKREGIVDVSATTGKEIRFRSIAHAPIIGTPHMWVAVGGGYLASWDERIVFIREQSDGALSFGWMVGENSWYSAIGGTDTAWLGKSRDDAGLYAIDLKDGHTRWSARLPLGIQDFQIGGDATTIVTSHEEYQHTPPGDHDIHRIFAAYDATTGKRRWRVELPGEPRASTIGIGGAVAVMDDKILLLDGATGARHAVALSAPMTAHVLVDTGTAFVEDENAHSLAAYSLATGRAAWKIDLPPPATVGITALSAKLAARGDKIFVAAHGEVHAFARATGALVWTVQTAFDPYRLEVTPSAIVGLASLTATGFVLPASPPALETATIYGTLRDAKCSSVAQTSVRVGNTRVHPDATGAFRATIHATGRIVVEVPFNRRREGNESVTSGLVLQLTGNGNYAVPDLVADSCSYDYE